MRIGVISREFPPFFGGGIGAYTRRWARALRECGHEPTVITVGGRGVVEQDRHEGIPVVRLPFLDGDDWAGGPHPRIRGPRNLAAFSQFWGGSVFAMGVEAALPGLSRELGLEAIEAPDTGALAWFALNRRRTDPGYRIPPLTIVVHSPSAWVDRLNRAAPGGRVERELASMELDASRMADALACPSSDLARQAEWMWGLPAGRIVVIPNPLGEVRAEPEPGAGEPERIAFFGRVEYRKGVDTLLAAFGEVAERRPGVGIDIVGEDTPDPASGESLSRALLGRMSRDAARRTRFHGKLEPDRGREVLRAARVVVVPSPDDNYPYTCVEAMASGRVVVASRAGGMREMIRDGEDGILFTPSDAADLARALGRALDLGDADRRGMGQRAAERITSLCGNRVVVDQRMAMFARTRAGSGGGARAAPGEFTILGRASASTRRALEAAMMNPDLDFAYPWSRSRRGVECFGPATPESLATARPTTVAARALAIEAVGECEPGEAAARLARAGFAGAPLPHAIEPRGAMARMFGRRGYAAS